MSEQIGFILVLGGLVVSIIGGVWLAARLVGRLFRADSTRGAARRAVLAPAALLAVGLVMGAAPLVSQKAYLAVVGLAERERVIEGQRAITLTGWDRSDYTILETKTDLAILEMSNPDVTDETLLLLRHLPALKELSLNDSSVTDRGLATLSGLPNLESLRIARTKVTPEGVAAFLASPPPKLRQIDVSGNGVSAEILRGWKAAGQGDSARGERRYVN